jgi:MFS family permease
MSDSADAILTRNLTRNFVLNVLDGTAFIFGVSLISRYTVLPLLVSQLSDERWLQGLIPALTYTGWLLPALFMAPFVASRPRRKPLILTATIGERLPYLVLGLILLLWPTLPPTTLLVVLFLIYGIYTLSGGIAMIAWQDFIARLIPERRWGTFFGLQFGLGGVLGAAGAALAATILAAWPFPQNFGILALICFSAQVVSYIFLSLTIEPPQPVAPRQPMRAFLGGIGPLLRRNQAFRRYLFCRAAIALGLVGHSFLTAAALERFHPTPSEIGLFTGVLLAVQALAQLGLGALADRWGHKQVLELSTGVGMFALLLAILAPTASWFLLVFALVGVAQAGYQLAGFTLVFSFSTPAERPTYIGVANTTLAPVAALGPLLAGWLAELAGYNALFVALLAIGIAGLLGLHWRVPAPVREAPAAAGE